MFKVWSVLRETEGSLLCKFEEFPFQKLLGPVVQKIKSYPRSLLLYPKVLFNTDIRQNFTLKDVNFEKWK